ncbi:MAG: pyridoxal phosphate-dependent aminotransferase [Chitinispirillales bacterium]|jgi:cystathionine beta-lyase|nr:pyridoxal phosphate-dependent aminotransferase [Chitinispirillales bacterium]
MQYNFDKIINRYGTSSLKYDFAIERGKPADVLPLWIADMDFPAPIEVLKDIQKAVSHGIFGYTETKEDYDNAVIGWFSERFGFDATPDEIVKTPGVVYALAQMLRAYTEPGDSVMIQTPVYYPFYEVIRDNDRNLIKNSLLYKDGKYFIDFEDFETKAAAYNVKLFILCSPHNPVGRVWTRDELETLNKICEKHEIIIVSDEIHCDFVHEGHTHTMFGHINANAVIATAPSKTFNLAGLQVSNMFIKNAQLRRKLKLEIRKSGYSQLNTLGLAACKSAYTHGGEWVNQLNEYLAGNVTLVRKFLSDKKIKLIESEGTYLLWLDCRELELPQTELDNLITHKAKLWLANGAVYGADGYGFMRMNIACPRKTLEEALMRLGRIV